jgi:hypothetical protein
LIGAINGHPFEFERLEKDAFLEATIDSYFGKLEPHNVQLERLLI